MASGQPLVAAYSRWAWPVSARSADNTLASSRPPPELLDDAERDDAVELNEVEDRELAAADDDTARLLEAPPPEELDAPVLLAALLTEELVSVADEASDEDDVPADADDPPVAVPELVPGDEVPVNAVEAAEDDDVADEDVSTDPCPDEDAVEASEAAVLPAVQPNDDAMARDKDVRNRRKRFTRTSPGRHRGRVGQPRVCPVKCTQATCGGWTGPLACFPSGMVPASH
jgi:hypothetical protein